MPFPKLKNRVSMGCLPEKMDLHVCPKSKIISKKPKSIVSTKEAEIETTIQNCQDVSSRTLVLPEDIANSESINKNEFLEKENPNSLHQQSNSLDFSALGKLERSSPCTECTETIFSPFELVEVTSQCCTQEDAGDSLDGDCLPQDYRSSEPVRFGAFDQHLVQAALENDTKVRNTCIVPHEEAMPVGENASFYSALCQMKSCSEDTDFKSDLNKTDCFDPQLFLKSLPELSDVESNDLSTQIPKQSQRRKSVTLVLDLDETLIHSTLEYCGDPDFTFKVPFNMKEYTVYVKQRPNLHTFLERVSEMFEVVIFTASQSIYAKKLLDILDPEGRLISRQVYRESCIFSDGDCTKDLTVLGVDLAKVAIIDNSPEVFWSQVNNGIPIKSWINDPLDCALMSLLPFLESLADTDDVRPIIAQRFGNKE